MADDHRIGSRSCGENSANCSNCQLPLEVWAAHFRPAHQDTRRWISSMPGMFPLLSRACASSSSVQRVRTCPGETPSRTIRNERFSTLPPIEPDIETTTPRCRLHGSQWFPICIQQVGSDLDHHRMPQWQDPHRGVGLQLLLQIRRVRTATKHVRKWFSALSNNTCS